VDGDQSDELLMVQRDQLVAVRPEQPAQPLWQRPVQHLWSDEIEGLLPASDGPGQCVVVAHVEGAGAVYALDAATGREVWTIAVPRPRHQGGQGLSDTGPVALLSTDKLDEPARLFWQDEQVAGVREATVVGRGALATAATDSFTTASRVPARLTGTADDPRLLRPLPWSRAAKEVAFLPAMLGWSLAVSLALLYLPGLYVLRTLVRRQWSLQWLLLAPTVVGIALVALLVEIPGFNGRTVSSRFLLALGTLPIVLSLIQLGTWSWRGRWRQVFGWLAAVIVVSALLAAWGLYLGPDEPNVNWQPGERYSWDGWWAIGLFGAYATACLLALVIVAGAIQRGAAAWSRGRTPLQEAS
jgi:hypothetical protein